LLTVRTKYRYIPGNEQSQLDSKAQQEALTAAHMVV